MEPTLTVTGPHGGFAVPSLWVERHWERPYHYLRSLSAARAASGDDGSLRRVSAQGADQLVWWTDVQGALSRSSLTVSNRQGLERDVFHALIRAAYRGLAHEPWLFGAVVTAGVHGWEDASWTLENGPRRLEARRRVDSDDELAGLAQGQFFLKGPGALFALGINWALVEAAGVDVDFAYAHALVSVGRVGHGILLEGQHHGLKARMTPAVHESSAAKVFDLDSERDVLYVLKLAHPAENS